MREGCERYVFIETFGCQMNENDTERMLAFLKDHRYRPTDTPDRADLILINTCSIRDKAEQKVYSTAGRYKRLKRNNPELVIGISGCVAQQKGGELLKRMPYVDIVVGTHNIHRLTELLKRVREEKTQVVSTELYGSIESGEFPTPEVDGVKAYVSCMRGCDNYCTYCIVPYVRGREVSRPHRDVIEDIRRLADRGIKEVTLLGQNVNSYCGDVSFPELLRMVCRVDGIERVRFLTSHPKDISEELIYLFGEEEKLARSMHLPIQAGSDRVLERMKRRYTVKEYLKKVSLFRRLYRDVSISTDMIVGFPGETEEDFRETMEVVRTVGFDSIFSFKYSPRPGTEAATYTDQLPEDVKQRRLEELQATQREITIRRNRLLVGRRMKVLVEGESKLDRTELTGRTTCNRIVNFPGDKGLTGSMVDVTIRVAYANSLRGEL